ncbi:CLUMA_CG017191, isoform A, partial [Clunio marinus]
MKNLLIGVALIVGASCQIYTQIGPDGYKYPKPEARFNLPDPVEQNEVVDEPQGCSNGGSGQYCCLNGADNPDCCDNGGRGPFCCAN